MDNAGTVKMKITLINLLHVFGDNQGSWGDGAHQIVSFGRNFLRPISRWKLGDGYVGFKDEPISEGRQRK